MFNKKQKIMLCTIVAYFLTAMAMNLLTIKTLQIGTISVFTCGILLTPLNFACNDIFTECAGEKTAFRIVLAAAGVNLVWALLCAICCRLKGNNEFISQAFSTVFGSTLRITAASIIAFVGGGWINNKIMSSMHKADGEKKYYKRAILSTALGQLVDDYVFIILAFAPVGISAIENPWSAIATVPLISAIVETILEAIVTPISKRICAAYKAAGNER